MHKPMGLGQLTLMAVLVRLVRTILLLEEMQVMLIQRVATVIHFTERVLAGIMLMKMKTHLSAMLLDSTMAMVILRAQQIIIRFVEVSLGIQTYMVVIMFF